MEVIPVCEAVFLQDSEYYSQMLSIPVKVE
jgi:hypothetical protein